MREKKSKMATEKVQILEFFLRNEFDTQAFEVCVFENDLEFWIEVNEYYYLTLP